jgi:hypothetical protein
MIAEKASDLILGHELPPEHVDFYRHDEHQGRGVEPVG